MDPEKETETKPEEQPKEGEGAKPDEPKADGPKGKPDAAIAASKYKEERDEARQQVADLTAQIEQLSESVKGMKSAEEVQAAVDEALSKANGDFSALKEKWEQRERELVVSEQLAKAGCIDSAAACAHIDMAQVQVGEDGKVSGVDVEALKASYPYLFGTRPQAGSTGFKPSGAPESDAALDRARAQFGLKENQDG